MALVTLRVLEGADRGSVFDGLPTPVAIGREEGNSIQLHDERVSRFHLKIQEDQNKLVLTDLESTNGTKVNGESVQMWLLRPGDVIAVGKTLLLLGSESEIAERLARLRKADLSPAIALDHTEVDEDPASAALEAELHWGDDPAARTILHSLLPPELPADLTAAQTAQLSELLYYVHLRLQGLLESVNADGSSEQVVLQQRQWQNLLDLQLRLANYLRKISSPE